MINYLTDIKTASLKEFMEWFTANYDGRYLSGDLSRPIERLVGLCAGMDSTHPAHPICSDALDLLRNYQHLLKMIEVSQYTYAGSHTNDQ